MDSDGKITFHDQDYDASISPLRLVENRRPLYAENYLLQVHDSTQDSVTVKWSPFLIKGESANLYADGLLLGNTREHYFTIEGLTEGQTISVELAPLLHNGKEGKYGQILATTGRKAGNQWIQVSGFSVASNQTIVGELKRLRWGLMCDRENKGLTGSRIMIRRYDTADIGDEEAEFLASRDFEGRRGYEVLPPTDTIGDLGKGHHYEWRLPEVPKAVYRAFLLPQNQAGFASKWVPGPIFTAGETWNPGANITPLWYSNDPGNGTITLIQGGVRSRQKSLQEALKKINPDKLSAGDGIEISGVVRADSADFGAYARKSGVEFRPIRIFGKSGPQVDSIRCAVLLKGPYTYEGDGRYSFPIPETHQLYKANTIWVNDCPLQQAGIPSHTRDIDKAEMGWSKWENPLYRMTPETMGERTFFWDDEMGKVWLKLPAGQNPRHFTLEMGYGRNAFSGVNNGAKMDYYAIENLTLAHSNRSALDGKSGSILGVVGKGWKVKNVAIIGGDVIGLSCWMASDCLIHNVLIDGAMASGMLHLGWRARFDSPPMRSLTQQVTFSALNQAQYFPISHFGLKRIPAHELYHERRCAVIPRTSNALATYLSCLAVGAWYDLPKRNNIHEECYFLDLPVGPFSEISPDAYHPDKGDFAVDFRNIMNIGLNPVYLKLNGTSIHTQVSSSGKTILGFITDIGGCSGIVFKGVDRSVNTLDLTDHKTMTHNCLASYNLLGVKEGFWSNVHIQGHSKVVIDFNYHINKFSGSVGFSYRSNRSDFESKTGQCKHDIVGIPELVDPDNHDCRTIGTSKAHNFGSTTPKPYEFRYF
jgi:hypothetical protein